jgi:hypothetical protein
MWFDRSAVMAPAIGLIRETIYTIIIADKHQRPDRHQQSFIHIFLSKQNASEGGKQGGIKRGADEIDKAEDDSEGGPRKKQYITTSNSVRESQGGESVLRRREL